MGKLAKKRDLDPLAYAVNFLSFRPRSRQEVDEALRKHAVSPTVREEVLERLAEMKLIDDVAFAESWIHFRTVAANPKGRLGVRQELREKGLEEAVIDAAIEEYYTNEMEQQLVKTFFDKSLDKFRRMPKENRERELKKLASRLEYRGFSAAAIYSVVADLRRACLDSSID